ncbi:UNVERIFIED_CONTAM: hypothetical protein Sangu_2708200, partial [Sesamum angustifolium]
MVETLTIVMEVEANRMRRDLVAMRLEKEHENKAKRLGNSKSSVNSSQLLRG